MPLEGPSICTSNTFVVNTLLKVVICRELKSLVPKLSAPNCDPYQKMPPTNSYLSLHNLKIRD